jgi:Fe-S-cluster containining protein
VISASERSPCATCGLCCRSYLVPVFGHDLYRLVRNRDLDPRTFTFVCEQEAPDKIGFRLQGNGPTYGLALDKKNRLEVTQPCTFLVEHDDGTSHCGVYEDRPIACATYPMVRAPDRIALLPAALCPPDAWRAEEPDEPHWSQSLRRLARYRDTYVEVVNRWNAWIDAIPEPARPAEHYVAYVLQVYDRLAALDAEMGDDALSTIEGSWATLAANAPLSARRDTEPEWIAYLRRVRAVIDAYFPDLPPLPFARISL